MLTIAPIEHGNSYKVATESKSIINMIVNYNLSNFYNNTKPNTFVTEI
ncbi:hypothetical protein BN1088_760003 [Sphingobacterium sp. PM2-P1-29]|nr:hypothetical protein BN1088_760003 [Sphingobacterium sp. PM2-P1-29]